MLAALGCASNGLCHDRHAAAPIGSASQSQATQSNRFYLALNDGYLGRSYTVGDKVLHHGGFGESGDIAQRLCGYFALRDLP